VHPDLAVDDELQPRQADAEDAAVALDAGPDPLAEMLGTPIAPEPPLPAAATPLPAAAAAARPAAVAPDPLAGEPGDPLKLGAAAVEAAKDAAQTPTVFAVSGAIAAVLWLIVAVLRRWGGVLLDGNKVRILSLIVGGLAGCAGQLADGLPWWQVVVLALSGPLAVAGNELFAKPIAKSFKRKPIARPVRAG